MIRSIVLVMGLCMTGLLAGNAASNTEATKAAAPADAVCESLQCGKCGDGYCNPRCGENEATCPRDCASY